MRQSAQEVIHLGKFSRAIRKALKERGLPMRAAAAEANVPVATMDRMVHSGAPNLSTYVALCRWLGVSTEEFLR